MGRKGNLFSAVKKLLKSELKRSNNQESRKSKKKWFTKKKRTVLNSISVEAAPKTTTVPPTRAPPPGIRPTEPAKRSVDKEQAKQAFTGPITEPAKQIVDKEQTKNSFTAPITEPAKRSVDKGQSKQSFTGPVTEPAKQIVDKGQAKESFTAPTAEPAERSVNKGQAKQSLTASVTEPAKHFGDKQQAKQSVTAPTTEPAKLSVDKEQTKHAYIIALATAKASEATVPASQAAAEVVRVTSAGNSAPSKEELAAIKLQTAFRGYMARRTFRALQGLMRLKLMIQGHAVKCQTPNTLKSMQARIQTPIRDRRMRMAEENFTRQQIQHKNAKKQAKELEKLLQTSNRSEASGRTMTQIEAKLQSKHEAAIRRERTLAYAFTHQVTVFFRAYLLATSAKNLKNPRVKKPN